MICFIAWRPTGPSITASDTNPTAIVNFILTLFIAFVLLQSFYLGNLKPQCRAHLTLIGIACELAFGLAIMDGLAPWLKRGG